MNSKYVRIMATMAVFCFFCHITVTAQEKKDVYEMTLEELLNTTVSVASKSEQTIGEAPSTVTVISQEEIKNLGVKTVEELLNYIPGFYVARHATGNLKEKITVRGGMEYDVLFMYNGQRINNFYQGIVSDGTQFIPIENIKQIEVIRGPGSALYGSNAFLGVVNIVTLDDVNNASFAVGNMDRREASVNYSLQIQDLKISAFAQGFSENGYEYKNLREASGRLSDTRDPVQGFNGVVTLNYKNFALNARHSQAQTKDFLMFGALGNNINNVISEQSFLNLKGNFTVNEQFDFDLTVGYIYEYWNAVFTQIPPGSVPIDGSGTLNPMVLAGGPLLRTYNWDVNWDARYKLSDINKIIFGLAFEYGNVNDCSNQGFWNYVVGPGFEYYASLKNMIPGKNFNEYVRRRTFGFYAQDEHKFGDQLNLTVGFRFDDYSDFGSTFNPRAALVYSTPFSSKIKLMYGQAYRAPNYSELYDKNNPTFHGNPKLKAVTVKTAEVAYVQEMKSFLGSLTLFHSELKDMILFGAHMDPTDPYSPLIYENLGTQKIQGVELELKTAIETHVLLTAGVSRIFQMSGLLVPLTTGSASVNYHDSYVNLNLSSLYRAKMDYLQIQDSYFLFNSRFSVHLVDNLLLSCCINNLANTIYYTHSPGLPNDGIINRGRTYTIGLEWSGE